MNIFGIEIQFANSNGKYIKRKECHQSHNELKSFLDIRFGEVNTRIDDLKDTLKICVDFINNR